MADTPSKKSHASADDKLTIASFTTSTLNECLYSVIHSLVLETHCKESALLQTLDPKTRIPLCSSCTLPRLLDPPLSISRPDKSTQYCSAVPWSTKPLHDIYGNPFPVAGSDKPPTKKEREARAKAEKEERKKGKNSKDDTPSKKDKDNDDDDDGPNIAGGPVDKKAAKVGERLKDGRYIPWHTCPSCKRSLLITRFAQHLEKCLGIGGRGRNAARQSTAGGSVGSGTPGGSRSGTPVPGGKKDGSGRVKDEDDSEDSDEDIKKGNVRKKVLKKGLKDAGKLGVGSGKKEGKLVKPGGGDREKENPSSSHSHPKIGSSAGEKRERDPDDDGGNAGGVKKKLKLQRQHSTVSLAESNVSMDNGSSVRDDNDMDESVDGSFVNPEEDEDASEDD